MTHYWAVRTQGFAYDYNPCRKNTLMGIVSGPTARAGFRIIDKSTRVIAYQYVGTDVAAALDEMRRVLKPDGQLLFCEHGLAMDANVQRWQKRLDPLWGKLAGGCHLTRDIPLLLREAHFRCDDLQSGYLPHAPRFAGYLYAGRAIVEA